MGGALVSSGSAYHREPVSVVIHRKESWAVRGKETPNGELRCPVEV